MYHVTGTRWPAHQDHILTSVFRVCSDACASGTAQCMWSAGHGSLVCSSALSLSLALAPRTSTSPSGARQGAGRASSWTSTSYLWGSGQRRRCVYVCMCVCVHVCTHNYVFCVVSAPLACPANVLRGQPTLPTGSNAGDPWDTQLVFHLRHCSDGSSQCASPPQASTSSTN